MSGSGCQHVAGIKCPVVAGRDLVTPRTVTLVTRAIVIVRLSGEGEAGRGQWTLVSK